MSISGMQGRTSAPKFPVRVLIVDDSITIRNIIKRKISDDSRLLVVGEASGASEAWPKMALLKPDVITLDIEMPGMNGIEFLRRVMKSRPVPVVMISSETQRGSKLALEALAAGAVECISKTDAGFLSNEMDNLANVLLWASNANLNVDLGRNFNKIKESFKWNGKIILIGSSTGGVEALDTVLGGFPRNSPPTLIAQHMPESFLKSFCSRLSQKILPDMSLASDGVVLKQGHIYLAPGGSTHLELTSSRNMFCSLSTGEKVGGYRPSVDKLFHSALPVASNIVAVILTGMGRDGAYGLKLLKDNGAFCIAQDESTSVIYGMPKAAADLNAAHCILPIKDISSAILDACSIRA